MATDCAVTAALPTITSTWNEESSATATLAGGFPELALHLSAGVPVLPPLLSGTAMVRSLFGTVTVT